MMVACAICQFERASLANHVVMVNAQRLYGTGQVLGLDTETLVITHDDPAI
jgi:hypothetical protein